ncbi:solute carrier family 12 member 9 [Plakobranchus ocellatus]|uniref:Solute carrier family 12 member 9 n=1 Tax=Plakobranchus ocellatus TaxID=259542 RepID=A0AAV3ZNN8_9GAST|nr:solute carrier family 12 member 9 [Plakobranchus ocellatus]
MARLFYNSTGVHMENGDLRGDEEAGEMDQAIPERVLGKGLLNLETAVTIDEEKTPIAAPKRSLASRLKGILFGSSDSEIKEKGLQRRGGYERFPSQVDLGRSLGLFAGVFAPVALGQFANNLFLRTGGEVVVRMGGMVAREICKSPSLVRARHMRPGLMEIWKPEITLLWTGYTLRNQSNSRKTSPTALDPTSWKYFLKTPASGAMKFLNEAQIFAI